MTCDEARALFSARADDAIAPDEATRLATHLVGCAECRAEWARFAGTISLVRGIERARAPAGFVDRVLEAARPEPWPLRLVRHVFMPMRVKLPVEAAAVMLIAGLAVMIFQRSPEMQQGARFEQPPTPPPLAAPPSEAPAVASRDVSPSAPAPAAPPASTEARAMKRDDAPLADRAARPDVPPASEPAAPQPAAPPPANVAQEAERGTGESARRETAAKSAAAPGTAAAPPTRGPLTARVRPDADATAQLRVRDRGAALTALASLATRLGGSELARREESGTHVIVLAIPQDAYETFIREASQLGTLTSERHRADPQSPVHVSIRVTDS